MRIRDRVAVFSGIALLAAMGALLGYVLLSSAERGAARYFIVGFEPMTAEDVEGNFFAVLPQMMLEVFDAFETGDDAAQRRALSAVATGDALEALYAERGGAMPGGGLRGTQAEDEAIHKLQMLRIRSDRDGQSFHWQARWRVVGTLAQSQHAHVRGNIYAADISIAPVDGAWRITRFALTDVDDSEVGQIVEGEP